MNNPLRVLLLTSKLSPAAGGLAVSVPGLAHSIDQLKGIEMHVMGTRDRVDPGAAERWGPRVHAFDVKGPQTLQYAPRMGSAIDTLAPDLTDVQGLWTYSSLVSLRYANSSGTPYIVTPRGMLQPWARRNSAWKKHLASMVFEKKHIRGAIALRATSEIEAQHFRDMGLTNPVAIIPNGLVLPDLAARTSGPLRTILFLSRIHPVKGVEFLLNAWADLHIGFPNWEVTIAGIDQNGHEAKLKKMAERLGLPRVQFVGEVQGAPKQTLYRNADLFVLPTRTENFGLVVAEALAQQTPVITTTNAPWEGLSEKGCGWWIHLDQATLTSTMRNALSCPSEELAAMGRIGRDWVERDFSMAQVAEKMSDVYQWAAGRASKPETVHE